MRARNLAGQIIGTMMRKCSSAENDSADEHSHRGFRWIKTDWTYPSFEHFTFAYKNQIFPVFVELFEDGRSTMRDNERDRFLDAASKNDLIPCTSRIEVLPKATSPWGFWRKKTEDETPFSLRPLSSGWNLWDLRTGDPIDPATMGDDRDVEMSEWEKLDFCVQIVKNYLTKEHCKITSCCNLPEIYPQIWFEDRNGYLCWCIVQYLPNVREDDHLKWVGIEKEVPQIEKYDGFFAGVSLASSRPVLHDKDGHIIPPSKRFIGEEPLYRGDGMFVNFRGIQRIHVAP